MNLNSSAFYSRKALFCATAFAISAIFCATFRADACSSLIIGKKKSATGKVIVGHTEDFGDNTAHKMFKSPAVTHKPGDKYVSFYGTEIPQPEMSFAYIASKAYNRESCPGDLNTGINQNFVAIVENEAWSRGMGPERNYDILKDMKRGGFLADDMSRLILERAKTAKEGVIILGEMIEKFGVANDPGAMFGIADPEEGWWVEVTPEGQWLAVRVPDDCAQMRANCYRLGAVDLNDSKNVMHSKDLVGYAVKKGWYDPAKDGAFNFAKAYGHPEALADKGNLVRMSMSEQLLEGDKKMGLKEAIAFIRTTYEGLKGRKVDPESGSPFRTGDRTISSMCTEMGFVGELDNSLPAEIGACGWWALSCPATGVFVPWNLGTTKFPTPFVTASNVYDSNSTYWKFVEIARLTDWKFKMLYPMVSTTWKDFENKEIADQARIREKASGIFKEKGAAEAAKFITDSTNANGAEVLRAADELLIKMKTKAYEEKDI